MIRLMALGNYRGFGEMTQAGDWTIVAVVRRGGVLVGTRAFSVAVK